MIDERDLGDARLERALHAVRNRARLVPLRAEHDPLEAEELAAALQALVAEGLAQAAWRITVTPNSIAAVVSTEDPRCLRAHLRSSGRADSRNLLLWQSWWSSELVEAARGLSDQVPEDMIVASGEGTRGHGDMARRSAHAYRAAGKRRTRGCALAARAVPIPQMDRARVVTTRSGGPVVRASHWDRRRNTQVDRVLLGLSGRVSTATQAGVRIRVPRSRFGPA